MADLVVGLGEIGQPLFNLLQNRNFKVKGIDPKFPETSKNLNGKYDMVHICIPYDQNFLNVVRGYEEYSDNIVIHSTVQPKTTARLNKDLESNVFYSPVRGIHNYMYEHLQKFQKYYSNSSANMEFEKRFPNSLGVANPTSLEFTKILVDTSYLGVLVWYRKFVDSIHPVYWHYASQINEVYGNRPILYNDGKDIGGHCVKPNLRLINDPRMRILREMVV